MFSIGYDPALVIDSESQRAPFLDCTSTAR
jgi:hypothetical protein